MVLNQAVLKLSGPLTRHHQVLFAPVFVSNRFSFLLFTMGNYGLDRIGRPHKVGDYFGIQAIVLVGSLSLLTERELGRADDIIDDCQLMKYFWRGDKVRGLTKSCASPKVRPVPASFL